jgi:prepilin-type N-terminal cleavage/methylation domain-containing protein
MIDPRIHRRTAGFTLLELMISIALVLILLVGVNYVFRTAVDSIGAGEQIIQFTQDSRTASRELLSDFNNVAPDPPCFIIASQIVPQFLNANDAQNGTDPRYFVDSSSGITYIYGTYIPTAVPAMPAPSATVVYIPAAVPNHIDHRCDMVRFYVHGLFPRRTGNDGTFISTTTSSAQDAFVTIGHAMLPTVDASVFVGPTTDGPSATLGLQPIPGHLVQVGWPSTNSAQVGTPSYTSYNSPVTYQEGGVTPTQRIGAYASDWVLARNVMLLRDPNTIAPNENGYARLNAGPPWYGGVNLTPIGNDSPDSSAYYGGVQSSRYDLAARTMEQVRRDVADAILYQKANYPTVANNSMNFWWNPLVYNLGAFLISTSGPAYQFMGVTGSPPTSIVLTPDLARMNANPQIPTPLSAQGVALMAPYFLQHASQFIVEYAGDYLQQDSTPADANYGGITGLGQDGQIDFVVDQYGNRRIRWYGMPRSTSGVPVGSNVAVQNTNFNNYKDVGTLIRGWDPPGSTDPNHIPDGAPTGPIMQQFIDVIPLRDYYYMYQHANGLAYSPPPWEVDINFDPAHDYGNPAAWPVASGGVNNAFQVNYTVPQTPGYANARYACAWYNDMPAMIRILIKVDDPNNKVKDGPWYEYVFKLK